MFSSTRYARLEKAQSASQQPRFHAVDTSAWQTTKAAMACFTACLLRGYPVQRPQPKNSTDLLQLVLMRAIPPALLNDMHVQPQTLQHVDPEVAELPIPEGHHLHSQELTLARHAAHRQLEPT